MKLRSTFILFLIFLFKSLSSQQISYFDTVWTNYFRLNSGGWTAGDATISVPLPDNRVIWLFGDSFTVPVDTSNNTLPCLFQVRNCYMVQDSVNRSRFKTILDTTQTGVNQSTFKIRLNDTTLLWPGHGYVWNDTIYIFHERYSNTNMGDFYGIYLSKQTFPDLHLQGIYPVHPNGNFIFGKAVLIDTAANMIYIYGNLLNWIVWEPVLARCPLNNPLGTWEYYTGSGWSYDPYTVQMISSDPVSPGFSVIKYHNMFYLITQENGYLTCGQGRQIYSYQSNYPWGPFVNKSLLYTDTSTFHHHYLLTYNAQAHPYFIENNNLLISYNVNDMIDTIPPNICPSQCVNVWTDRLNADTYRPKFIRVPMGIITGTQSVDGNILSMTIIPNPVNAGSEFTLNLNSGNNLFKISTCDLLGRTLKSQTIISQHPKTQILLRAPDQVGVYFLKAEGPGYPQTEVKMVVY